jgi:hypothetical protein
MIQLKKESLEFPIYTGRVIMAQDISKFLAYEIKKELAERYFGFRKIIEEDIQMLNEGIKKQNSTVEQKIGHTLSRIYIILKDEKMIQTFFKLSGLEEKLFYDPYLSESINIRKRVFEGVKVKGLTRSIKFKKLLFNEYGALVKQVKEYREKYILLQEDQEVIEEEIKLFYKKNDLSSILDFLRTIDHHNTHSELNNPNEPGLTRGLEEKMKVKAPIPVEHFLSLIPALTPLKDIRGELKKLAKMAFTLHGDNVPGID